MLNYFFWGENAFGFHIFQILFHILNASLIYLIFTRLGEKSKNRFSKVLALVIAGIYTVHPGIAEGVIYIAAVSEVMFTFFILLAFYLILKTGDLKPGLKTLISVSLLLFGACLFKEPAVVGVPVLIAYILLFLKKYRIRWITALGITFAAYFFVRLVVVQTPIQHPLYSLISEASLQERLMTIPAVMSHYLTIIFYPQYLAISQHFVVRSAELMNFFIPITLLILIGLSALVYGFKSGNKLVLFALIYLVISLGPILNIIPLDMTVAERWLYFPLTGFLLLVYAVILDIKNQKSLLVIISAISLVIIPLSIRTVVRNADWKNGMTLYTHDTAINPESFDLQNNLGVELFRAGDLDKAKFHFEKSLSLQPKWHFSLNNLGAIYQRQGNYEEAKKYYLEVLKTSDYYLAHENLSSIYVLEKDYEGGKVATEKSLEKLPNNPGLWLNLAVIKYKLGDKEGSLKAAQNSYSLDGNEQATYLYSALSQGKELQFEQ